MRRTFLICAMLLTAAHALPASEAQRHELQSTSAAHVANEEFTYSPNWPEPPDTAGMLLRLGFGTVATLGLCVATLVLGRRWIQRQTPHSASRKLQIEESVVLGHRATLFLVKVGDSHLVAGTDAGGLKSLIVLPATFSEVLEQHVETAEVVSSASTPLTVWKASPARAA